MVEINNTSLKYRNIDKNFLKKVAEKILKKEHPGKIAELSVALVNPEEIRVLNKKYRKKDRPTDVLSFGDLKEEMPEIVICPEEVKKNAGESGESFKKELSRVLIHGILHLAGYDHEKAEKEAKKMFAKQEEYLSKLISK
jgi:probable rRNA maturation factor